MKAQGGSPNLINGVSRQPAELRLPSQLEESINLFPSVPLGLRPRNPVERVAGLTGFPSGGYVHLIDRDDAEKYAVSITSTGIKVFDFAGGAKMVAAPSGYGYLAGAGKADIDAVTVDDYTFILNKKKTVGQGSTASPALEKSALLHVAAADYRIDYKIILNGTLVTQYKTGGGPFSEDNNAQLAEKATRPSRIAQVLATGAVGADLGSTEGNVVGTVTGGLNTLDPATWSVTVIDNVIYLKNKLGQDFTISVEASGRDNYFRAHKGLVTDYSFLPTKAIDGFRIKVAGSKDTEFDDYWVEFDQGANDGAGRWKETIGPGIPLSFNASTMPHVLVREADGTFTFKPATWDSREVGDLDTSPWPSFVGNQIGGILFHKNRLGFFSGEAVSLSRNGSFFNFFIETAQELLDTDPIDVAISYPKVSTIFHAVALSSALILFTTSIPFSLQGGDLLTAKSAHIDPVMSNRVRAGAKPLAVGTKLYFSNDLEAGSTIHEFTYNPEVGVVVAPSISEHVSGYLPGSTTQMVGDDTLKFIGLRSDAEPDTLYGYKWLFIGQERAQSAWFKWTLPGACLGMEIVGDWLYIVGLAGAAVELWRIKLHDAWADQDGVTAHMDRRVTVSGTYDAASDKTTFTLPYAADGATLTAIGTSFGQAIPGEGSGSQFIAYGDWSADSAFAGFDFDAWGELSEQFVRSARQDGSGTAKPGVKLRLGAVTFETAASVAMDVDVVRAYRDTYQARLRVQIIGTKTDILGTLKAGKLPGRVSVMASAEDTRLIFRKAGVLGFSLLSFGWTGTAYLKGY